MHRFFFKLCQFVLEYRKTPYLVLGTTLKQIKKRFFGVFVPVQLQNFSRLKVSTRYQIWTLLWYIEKILELSGPLKEKIFIIELDLEKLISEDFLKNDFERVKNTEIKNLKSIRVVDENFYVWEALITFDTWPYINRGFKIQFEFPGKIIDFYIYLKLNFLLLFKLLESYPFSGPRVKFLTLIYHPNIGEDGRICSHCLRTDRSWNRNMKIEDILNCLSNLINWSDLNNPLMYELADGKELYFKDKFYCSL